MVNLKEQYEQIVKEREKTLNALKELENNEVLKRYLELRKQNENLAIKQLNIYKKLKVEEYDSCNHIWVNVLHDYDSCEGRSDNYYGCIKCGLDQRVFEITSRLRSIDYLTLEQQIMYDYMYGRYVTYKGINTHISCDLDIAREIYSRIKESHDNIDDKSVVELFETELRLVKKKQ